MKYRDLCYLRLVRGPLSTIKTEVYCLHVSISSVAVVYRRGPVLKSRQTFRGPAATFSDPCSRVSHPFGPGRLNEKTRHSDSPTNGEVPVQGFFLMVSPL